MVLYDTSNDLVVAKNSKIFIADWVIGSLGYYIYIFYYMA